MNKDDSVVWYAKKVAEEDSRLYTTDERGHARVKVLTAGNSEAKRLNTSNQDGAPQVPH